MTRRVAPLVALAALFGGTTVGCSSGSSAEGAPSDGDAADVGAALDTSGSDVGSDGHDADARPGPTDSRVGDGADAGASDADASGDASGDTSGAASDAPVDGGAARALLGVYCGNNPDDVVQFETWLGKKVDGVLGYTGNASWADFDGSVGWATGVWSALDRRVLWSVPLIPTGATLDEAAKGTYDDHYVQAAKTLAAFRPGDAVLYVRTGWEFNGDWMPWTAHGNPTGFVGAFRHFVQAFRSVSKRFVIEWNVNIGDAGMNPEDAYPGDDVVDLIGMDFYWNTDWDPKDPEAAWTQMRTEKWGLDWHQAFAATHHKPTTYAEWGIRSDAAAPYIAHAKDWFDTHPVVYHTYWNSDASFPGKLSGGAYPTAGAAYRTAFGP